MYRLENNVEVYKGSHRGEFIFVKRGTGQEDTIECDENGISFINSITRKGGSISKLDALNNMDYIKLLQKQKLITSNELPKSQDHFRSQYQTFEEWGINPDQAQIKIKNANIAIIGCGGVGGWLAFQLASMGIEKMQLIDNELVEECNIIRQPFSHSDIGKHKVNALADILRKKNEKVALKKNICLVTTKTNMNSLLQDCDYICVAADYPSRNEMGQLIGQWCLENNKIHFICGGYSGHNSSLGITVIPQETACWNCYLNWYKNQISDYLLKRPIIIGPKSGSGLLPTVLIAASMSALDIIRVIIGMPPILKNSKVDLNPMDLKFSKMDFPHNMNCKFCRAGEL